MKNIRESLNEKLLECKKHIEKIEDSKDYLKDILPLKQEKYLKLNKIQSSFIDQLIYRFSKLQDTMGENIFRKILILANEDIKRKTFLDILNRLEELEILKKDDWLILRELRNDIAHEYSFNTDEVIENINLVVKKTDNLKNIFEKIDKFIKDRLSG